MGPRSVPATARPAPHHPGYGSSRSARRSRRWPHQPRGAMCATCAACSSRADAPSICLRHTLSARSNPPPSASVRLPAGAATPRLNPPDGATGSCDRAPADPVPSGPTPRRQTPRFGVGASDTKDAASTPFGWRPPKRYIARPAEAALDNTSLGPLGAYTTPSDYRAVAARPPSRPNYVPGTRLWSDGEASDEAGRKMGKTIRWTGQVP